jgi:hypothetical protein
LGGLSVVVVNVTAVTTVSGVFLFRPQEFATSVIAYAARLFDDQRRFWDRRRAVCDSGT